MSQSLASIKYHVTNFNTIHSAQKKKIIRNTITMHETNLKHFLHFLKGV